MSNLQLDIQYVTDKQGNRIFVQIPFTQWEKIRPEVVRDDGTEETAKPPVLIDKDGILVVRGEPFQDLTDVTRNERERRVPELIYRTGL
jgi:hypothetical protein